MSYTPTEWKSGDTITSTKLNKMEQGIAAGGSGGGATICQCTYDDNEGSIISPITASEMWTACQSGVVILQYSYPDSGAILTYAEVVVSAYIIAEDNTIVGYRFSAQGIQMEASSGTDYPVGYAGGK